MQTKEHWEKVYGAKASNEVSWFQEHANVSLDLIRRTGVGVDAAIIDVGGGASTLVDDLLASGHRDVTVLDLSGAALAAARRRLGPRAANVQWLESDITTVALPARRYDVWHDRAVFHFLVAPEDRGAYIRAVLRAVKPGGHVIIATFAEDGPEKCSGLPVVRYRAEELHAEFGTAFTLTGQQKETHLTPLGAMQQFVYCYCRVSDGTEAEA